MKDNRSLLQIKTDAALRLAMWHFFQKPLGLVLVSEYPKSGGSWFCQMLAAALDIPFPRNRYPILGASVLHGHQLYHPRFGKIVGVVRDGRDVMVSAYFYFLFENERNPPLLVKKTRKALPFSDYEDVENNMPRFIEYMFEEYAGSRFHFTWSQWVQSFFENENVVLVKYEDLLKDAKAELKKTIRFLEKELPLDECLTEIVQRFSFENMTKRLPGEENRNSFLRKGIAGDWKNYFSQKAIDIFGEYAGRELEGLGYR